MSAEIPPFALEVYDETLEGLRLLVTAKGGMEDMDVPNVIVDVPCETFEVPEESLVLVTFDARTAALEDATCTQRGLPLMAATDEGLYILISTTPLSREPERRHRRDLYKRPAQDCLLKVMKLPLSCLDDPGFMSVEGEGSRIQEATGIEILPDEGILEYAIVEATGQDPPVVLDLCTVGTKPSVSFYLYAEGSVGQSGLVDLIVRQGQIRFTIRLTQDQLYLLVTQLHDLGGVNYLMDGSVVANPGAEVSDVPPVEPQVGEIAPVVDTEVTVAGDNVEPEASSGLGSTVVEGNDKSSDKVKEWRSSVKELKVEQKRQAFAEIFDLLTTKGGGFYYLKKLIETVFMHPLTAVADIKKNLAGEDRLSQNGERLLAILAVDLDRNMFSSVLNVDSSILLDSGTFDTRQDDVEQALRRTLLKILDLDFSDFEE